MKFQPDHLDGVNVIAKLEAQRIWVHQTPFTTSLVVPWVGDTEAWPATRPQELTPAHFERIAVLQPEVVIFGSGPKLQFISPQLYRCLIERRIGMETMDTAAACRTYNVLVNEGRKVVGAFLLA